MSRILGWTRFIPMTLAIAIATSTAGCGGCNMTPLPGGKLPADQTVEGGGQVRVTPAGLSKLASLIPAVINGALANGVCVPHASKSFVGQTAEACFQNGCSGGAEGCKVNFKIDSLNWSVKDAHTLTIAGTFDANAPSIPVRLDTTIGSTSCTLSATAKNVALSADIAVGTDPNTGELQLSLANVNNLDLSGLNFSGCSFVSSVINFVKNLFSTSIGNAVINLLKGTLNNLLQNLLPKPLGVAGVVDIGSLLSSYSPGAKGNLETRIVAGGYASLQNGGISTGLITGFNSDRDPTTRTPDKDSEPALCVPPLPVPNLAAPPASLSTTRRGTFSLQPADEFVGNPDPSADVAIGISNTTLDLAGHHLVTSGGLCLGIGTQALPQLTLGTIGLLVPSLAELGNAKDPLLLETRPQQAITFSIGDGTKASPRITAHAHNFEIDVYAYLYQRWVRGFTISLDLDLGVNLAFTTDAKGNPEVTPMLVGLDSKNIGITVENSEFLREKPSDIQSVLPSLFNALIPVLAGSLKPIPLPSIGGFNLTNLSVNKVTTSEDDFVAIEASLGTATAPIRKLAAKYPALADKLGEAARLPAPVQPVETHASLANVTAPTPAQMRAALAGKPGGALPQVVIDVDSTDAAGQPLEWTWSLDGGMWRTFTRQAPLVIRDKALALEGHHTVRVRARVVGDYRTLDPTGVSIPFVIDSVGPQIFTNKATVSGGALTVPAVDLVSPPKDVTVAYGRPDGDAPATPWSHGPVALSTVKGLAGSGHTVTVYAKDGSGNQSSAPLDLTALTVVTTTPTPAGCAIGLGGSGGGGAAGTLLVVLAGLLGLLALRSRSLRRLVGRRAAAHFRTLAPFIIIAVAVSLTAACGGKSSQGSPGCQTAADCSGMCTMGQVPACANNMCLCNDDVPFGRLGSDSAMALAKDGSVWVSAYNSGHGDLMVAHYSGTGRIPNDSWKFIDGVPSGPVAVPGSKIRGGITAPGDDVGKYTDIAIAPDGTVMVSYFDQTHNSLKFAANYGGTWTTETVDAGGSGVDPNQMSIAGMYTSITIRKSDGRPAIAYFAEKTNGSTTTTEVRYAAAQTAKPMGASDWLTTKVDSLDVPAMSSGDVFPIPEGLGLYIDSARKSDGSTVVVYYDRTDGELKESSLDTTSGAFTTPVVLDGGSGNDVGLYPSVAVDGADKVHVTYASADQTKLFYLSSLTATPAVIDDGYRIVGQTQSGLPKPEFHFVGADSSLVFSGGKPVVAYQDATDHLLLLGYVNTSGAWQHMTVAGGTNPFKGGYGFYASAADGGTNVVISNWVIDQPNSDAWVEIHRPQLAIQ